MLFLYLGVRVFVCLVVVALAPLNHKVEIVFPVASEAMTATGEEGEGSMGVVPGVSGE